jgi:ribonuclease HI
LREDDAPREARFLRLFHVSFSIFHFVRYHKDMTTEKTNADIVMSTDGGARGNPGPAGAGAYIVDGAGNKLASVSAYLGERTNNWAEYEAIILGLEKLRTLYGDALTDMTIVVRMDSELIVRQLNGVYKVKNADLKEQYAKVQELLSGLKHINIVHVRREYNKEADALANEAMDKGSF